MTSLVFFDCAIYALMHDAMANQQGWLINWSIKLLNLPPNCPLRRLAFLTAGETF